MIKEKFNIVIERLKSMNLSEEILCSAYWRKILKLQKNFNEKICWKLLFDHIEWCINTETISSQELQEWFTKEELAKHCIYTEGKHELKNVEVIGLGTAQLEVSGHSRVVLFDKAFCSASDTTFVTGFNDSSFVLNECMGTAFHNVKVTANRHSKVEGYDKAEIEGFNYALVILNDEATCKVFKEKTVVVRS